MTAKRRKKQNTLQMICSIVILICFSLYGIGLMVLNDRTLWKVLCCIIGLLYAVIIQIIIHTGKEW